MALKGYEHVASVRFTDGINTSAKVYNFALYEHLVVGDFALVKATVSSSGFGVVRIDKITPVSEYEGTLPTAEIICKVNMSEYLQRVGLRKERDVLKKKMDKMVKESQELLVYQTIAANNPEMAELVSAYMETLKA